MSFRVRKIRGGSVNIKRLENELQSGNNDFSKPDLQNIVKTIEGVLSEGLQANPRDPYLLAEQAQLATVLKDSPRIIASLEKAVEHNSKLPFLAIQLSDCYLRDGNFEKAKQVLERSLDANRNNRSLNYRLALFLTDHGGSLGDVAYFLSRSFTPGDRNYDALEDRQKLTIFSVEQTSSANIRTAYVHSGCATTGAPG